MNTERKEISLCIGGLYPNGEIEELNRRHEKIQKTLWW